MHEMNRLALYANYYLQLKMLFCHTNNQQKAFDHHYWSLVRLKGEILKLKKL